VVVDTTKKKESVVGQKTPQILPKTKEAEVLTNKPNK